MRLRDQSPYQGYAYAYPHKTAYRPLDPPRRLARVWAPERRDALFLYLHVPFCEMRCGFCNLFTTVGARDEAQDAYLDAVERQARVVVGELGAATFARAALGGGTPTLLSPARLARVFDLLADVLGLDGAGVPVSIETSPATARPERLAVLEARGVRRVSIGVQSFVEAEVRAAGRPERTAEVERALSAIRARRFEVLNVDLMYGLPGQTAATWGASLQRAMAWAPEEVFLYPLYVRPKTGLHRLGARAFDDVRLARYRQGREYLLGEGYQQVSMRQFRRGAAPAVGYRCQADGMVGLGAGARSYTRALHYAREWGVGRARVREILDTYVARTDAAHALADHGIALTREEQQRRHVQQSLLCDEGLQTAFYRSRFGTDPHEDFASLGQLVDEGLAERRPGWLGLTADGVERSDAIGPWLVSPAVRRRMQGFALQ